MLKTKDTNSMFQYVTIFFGVLLHFPLFYSVFQCFMDVEVLGTWRKHVSFNPISSPWCGPEATGAAAPDPTSPVV